MRGYWIITGFLPTGMVKLLVPSEGIARKLMAGMQQCGLTDCETHEATPEEAASVVLAPSSRTLAHGVRLAS